MDKNQNLAFGNIPINDENGNYLCNSQGLTKREYFAIRALQSIIILKSEQSLRDDVLSAVNYADLLISELEEKPSRNIQFVSKDEAIKALNQCRRVWHRSFLEEEYIIRVDDSL